VSSSRLNGRPRRNGLLGNSRTRIAFRGKVLAPFEPPPLGRPHIDVVVAAAGDDVVRTIAFANAQLNEVLLASRAIGGGFDDVVDDEVERGLGASREAPRELGQRVPSPGLAAAAVDKDAIGSKERGIDLPAVCPAVDGGGVACAVNAAAAGAPPPRCATSGACEIARRRSPMDSSTCRVRTMMPPRPYRM
jgi:hypothetical protein